MRLVFAGTPQAAVPSLDALLASSHEVAAVLTRPDAPAGRGRRMTPSPVAARAEALGLEVLRPGHPRESWFQERLRELAPDACPVVAYGALLPPSALEIPRHGWINLHFSLLPRWRGAAPVQRAVMAGDPRIGTCCFRIVSQLDAGDVYLMDSIPMPDETAGELLDRLAVSGARQLVDCLDLVEAGAEPTPQDATGVTLAPKVAVEEARLDWRSDSRTLRNQIMGCSPAPGAWCELDGQRFKVLRARVAEPQGLAPGELRATKRELFAGTGDGSLELLEVQAAGKRRVPGADWARPGVAGKVLG